MTSNNPAAARALAALALLASTDAGAVTVTSLAGAPDPVPLPGQQLVVSFDAPAAPGFSWTGGLATAIDAIAANFRMLVIVVLPSTMRLPSREQFKQSLNAKNVTYFLPLRKYILR